MYNQARMLDAEASGDARVRFEKDLDRSIVALNGTPKRLLTLRSLGKLTEQKIYLIDRHRWPVRAERTGSE